MEKIVGITIGPILETINESKEISHIANASLFFSTLVYEFLNAIEKEKYEILSPSFEPKNSNKFYPDRILLKVKNSNLEEAEVLAEVESIYKKIIEANEYLSELEDYINFNILVVELEKGELTSVFKYLDGMELIKNFSDKFDEKKIIKSIEEFLGTKKKLNTKYAVNMGVAEGEGYRAIVALDLDNMGQYSQAALSSSSSTSEGISKISKEIYTFIEKLNQFKAFNEEKGKREGLVIYSAGDDILAILNPLHIPEFIKYACNCLKECFKSAGNNETNLSISFGIFVCYAKHPIKEAIEKTYELLFQMAKENKNEAVILFQKHSGQSFDIKISNLVSKKGFEFNEENIYYENFSKFITSKDDENKERLLNTIIQKLSLNSFVFKSIKGNKRQIESYLEELFDEKEVAKNQLKILSAFLEYIGEKSEDEFDIEFKQLLSFFRILKFYASKGGN